MKKIVISLTALSLFAVGLGTVAGIRQALARVNIGIEFSAPVIDEDEPEDMVVIPESGVYFVPDAPADIFFFDGFWWARRGPYWYRSRTYRGRWSIARGRDVPPYLYGIPRDYRWRYRREHHMRYRDWRDHQEPRDGRGAWGNDNRRPGMPRRDEPQTENQQNTDRNTNTPDNTNRRPDNDNRGSWGERRGR